MIFFISIQKVEVFTIKEISRNSWKSELAKSGEYGGWIKHPNRAPTTFLDLSKHMLSYEYSYIDFFHYTISEVVHLLLMYNRLKLEFSFLRIYLRIRINSGTNLRICNIVCLNTEEKAQHRFSIIAHRVSLSNMKINITWRTTNFFPVFLLYFGDFSTVASI